MVSKEMVDEFSKLYRARFGEDLSADEALAQATALLQLMKAIYQPIEKNSI